MFHGGTSFGFMNGANIDGSKYEPDTTSYDYDAPLNERRPAHAEVHRLSRSHHPRDGQDATCNSGAETFARIRGGSAGGVGIAVEQPSRAG